MFEVEVALSVYYLLQTGDVVTAQAQVHLALLPLQRAQQLPTPLPAHLQLHAHQRVPELGRHRCCPLHAAEHRHCAPAYALYLQRYHFSVGGEGGAEHLVREGEPALPPHHHCAHLLVVLLRSHLPVYLPPQLLSRGDGEPVWFRPWYSDRATLLAFVDLALGREARAKIELIVDDPPMVAIRMKDHVDAVLSTRDATDESFSFDWSLVTPLDLQRPFETTHASMAALPLERDQPVHQLAANLRRAFSGIVSGNVKEAGMRLVEEHGPFELRGDPNIMQALDGVLRGFVGQGRMRLPGREYVPCYRVAV